MGEKVEHSVRTLAAATLLNAITDLIKFPEGRSEYSYAYRWIYFPSERDYTWSFGGVCSILERDPEYVREKITPLLEYKKKCAREKRRFKTLNRLVEAYLAEVAPAGESPGDDDQSLGQLLHYIALQYPPAVLLRQWKGRMDSPAGEGVIEEPDAS